MWASSGRASLAVAPSVRHLENSLRPRRPRLECACAKCTFPTSGTFPLLAGLDRPTGMAERLVVPTKPGNAGGGKGPQL